MISLNLKKRIITSLILLSLCLLIIRFNFFLLYSLIIIGVFSIIEFSYLFKNIKIHKTYKFLINIFFILYLFTFLSLFFILSNFIELKIILFSFVFCCVASDLGGYMFGKIFKGPKLTKISPNKTISGAIGSILLSSFVMYFIFSSILSKLEYKILIIGILTSVFCQLGDLLFSYLKRKAKMKDTGNFLPGHGGVLDRFDGMFLGIPIGFAIFSIIFI